MVDEIKYVELDSLGYSGYKIGSDATVWSRRRGCRSGGFLGEWKQLNPNLAKNGYYIVNMRLTNGLSKREYIHTLLLLAFIGPRPAGYVCRHLDGVPTNNELSNICWGTRKENMDDRKTHGTDNAGSRHGLSKLTEDDVRWLREMCKTKEVSRDAIAKRLKICRRYISDIYCRRVWKHV